MAEDIAANLFDGDDLLDRVRTDLDAFYWQSHTLSHLGRDNLGANDCDIEDAGELHTFVRERQSLAILSYSQLKTVSILVALSMFILGPSIEQNKASSTVQQVCPKS